MRGRNLAGTVEVVLREHRASRGAARLEVLPDEPTASSEVHQLTGCTSKRTIITFTLTDNGDHQERNRWTDVYVLDSRGSVLARADAGKLPD